MGLFGTMGAGALWGLSTLFDPRVMPLRIVRIEGDFKRLTREALQRAVADVTRGNFFTVDVNAVRDAGEDLPWVAQV